MPSATIHMCHDILLPSPSPATYPFTNTVNLFMDFRRSPSMPVVIAATAHWLAFASRISSPLPLFPQYFHHFVLLGTLRILRLLCFLRLPPIAHIGTSSIFSLYLPYLALSLPYLFRTVSVPSPLVSHPDTKSAHHTQTPTQNIAY